MRARNLGMKSPDALGKFKPIGLFLGISSGSPHFFPEVSSTPECKKSSLQEATEVGVNLGGAVSGIASSACEFAKFEAHNIVAAPVHRSHFCFADFVHTTN